MIYVVKVPITGVHNYCVEADSPEDAINRVSNGEGDFYEDTEIVEDLDFTVWEADLDLSEWAEEEKERIADFAQYWMDQHEQYPALWPLDQLAGDFDEQYAIWSNP